MLLIAAIGGKRELVRVVSDSKNYERESHYHNRAAALIGKTQWVIHLPGVRYDRENHFEQNKADYHAQDNQAEISEALVALIGKKRNQCKIGVCVCLKKRRLIPFWELGGYGRDKKPEKNTKRAKPY